LNSPVPTPRSHWGRCLPKVTVTRAWGSLCQKGVTRWPCFLVNCLWAPKRVKTSRGRAASLNSRPLRSEVGGRGHRCARRSRAGASPFRAAPFFLHFHRRRCITLGS
jgi:hypothetical protein